MKKRNKNLQKLIPANTIWLPPFLKEATACQWMPWKNDTLVLGPVRKMERKEQENDKNKNKTKKPPKTIRFPQQPGRPIAFKMTENGTLSPPSGSPRKREPC